MKPIIEGKVLAFRGCCLRSHAAVPGGHSDTILGKPEATTSGPHYKDLTAMLAGEFRQEQVRHCDAAAAAAADASTGVLAAQ